MAPKSGKPKGPDFAAGIAYWEALPPTLDTVLGGLAASSLPLVDALSSRQLLLSLFPQLRTFSTPHNPRPLPVTPTPAPRALDVGAGIGRVTSKVLLHMFTYVDMVEPVESFLQTAISESSDWKGIKEGKKGVRFIKAPLQDVALFSPVPPEDSRVLASVGKEQEGEGGYDAIWCQWCLGHLSKKDLVVFCKRAQKALRSGGYIIAKENVCADNEDGSARDEYDAEDSTVTRSNQAWLDAFESAGLEVVQNKIQLGFPEFLYEVRSYVLR
ncbi:DUF858-domain-containing protein [Calocera viscosa TUFC12733]|uniref:Alpha N-terminal protein methyltransferase 1 n=1 Tax=Calocera viscosa (strain TUFC12733) TaxID=1330018 RepID=A0A167LMC6_CALVF|nr:DUF858-domain-containing protein [Calocera viscosa TUFC12733]